MNTKKDRKKKLEDQSWQEIERTLIESMGFAHERAVRRASPAHAEEARAVYLSQLTDVIVDNFRTGLVIDGLLNTDMAIVMMLAMIALRRMKEEGKL